MNAKIKALQNEALQFTAKARAISEKAQAEARDFTAQEKAEYAAATGKAKSYLEQIKTLKADDQIMADAKSLAAQLGGFPTFDEKGNPVFGGGATRSKGRVGLAGKAGKELASRIAGDMVDGQKALLPAGTAHAGVPLLPEMVELGHPSNTLLDALVALPAPGPTFKALVQRERTNNAAPVAEGETKPTSVFGLEEIEVNLEVLAHLSEPTPRYWFEDNAALETFVQDELVRGLRDALEGQVLTGDGTRPNLQGVLTTSGVQVQSFTTDVARSVRSAITKLETAGHEDNHVIVLRPEDWEAAETARAEGSGQLEAVANVTQRAQRTLWGVPVVVSNALPLGTGLVLDREAVVVYSDNVVDVRWSETVADDFQKNLVRARVESRYAAVVSKPLGVVRVATVATP
ncbi:phage major capsid protein [Rhodococcus pyridinivorans]|uniref:Phage major capsid protein n=1 Tax=Rhodococcus pyridinivorans TaxID=103816 RepID=A0A7M2XPA7_9NOCA|nr:phage major capsid protein [Rhodococcus pyridinivorans]QOV99716.1 phage major capsid protein [Rhodococcus pyridinivorans]